MNYKIDHFKFETVPQRLRQEIINDYEKIKVKKDKDEFDKMFLQVVRQKMKAVKMKLVVTHLPTNTIKSWVLDTELDKIDRIKYIKDVIDLLKLNRLTAKRALNKTIKKFDGAEYETVAGVFLRRGDINEIAKRTTVNDPMKAKAPRKAKANYVGIELEFNDNVQGMSTAKIGEALKTAGLARYVHVGTDGSCGYEVRVLLDDQNFIEPLSKICTVLRHLGFTADHRCGGHVHLDMRNRDVKKCYANLFKAQMFLRKLLPKSRKKNSFCIKNTWPTFDEHDNQGRAWGREARYSAINIESYKKYSTLEIRMHQGTLDEKKLIQWIKLLLKIVDYEGNLEKVPTLKRVQSELKIESDLYNELRARLLTRGA